MIVTHIQKQPNDAAVAQVCWISAQSQGTRASRLSRAGQPPVNSACRPPGVPSHRCCGQESHLLLYLQRLSRNIQLETLPTASLTCLGSLSKPYPVCGQTRQTSLTKRCRLRRQHRGCKFAAADKAKASGEYLLLLCVQLLRGEEEEEEGEGASVRGRGAGAWHKVKGCAGTCYF